ncbi:hypothetical protein BC828DRAFT_405220 [Blastocladiella britannica]|nr:hypothetical protein BC828DRAFT_405220 [Blastocladiella britannica]
MAFYNALKRLRLTVNPNVVEADIWGGTFRQIAPASQPKFVPPETENSRVSNNYYFQRDHRRDYPQTTVYANPLAQLAEGSAVKSLAAGPGMAIATVTAQEIAATAADLPTPPSIHQHTWARSTDSAMPTDSKTTYFPVAAYV